MKLFAVADKRSTLKNSKNTEMGKQLWFSLAHKILHFLHSWNRCSNDNVFIFGYHIENVCEAKYRKLNNSFRQIYSFKIISLSFASTHTQFNSKGTQEELSILCKTFPIPNFPFGWARKRVSSCTPRSCFSSFRKKLKKFNFCFRNNLKFKLETLIKAAH